MKPSIGGNRNKNSSSWVLVSITLLISVILPQRSDAAVLSRILDVLKSDPIIYKSGSDYTSQNMPILKPSRNIDPLAVGGGDVTIVSDSALVSEVGPAGTIADITESNKHGEISTYTVEKGDTIQGIAKEFDVSVNTIKWANDLKSDKLKVGQELVILPITGVRYTIKRGGTIRDIVKKYGGDVEEVALYNGVDADEELSAGTEVIVPHGEVIVPIVAPKVKKVLLTSKPHNVGGPNYSGYFVHPLNYMGVKTQGVHGWNAVDLGAPVGTPIIAAAAGTVVISKQPGWNGGYGAYVVIRHGNGTQTLYAHMSSNLSSVGQDVYQGQTIGYVGNTGKSTGPHLHFEVRGASNPF